MLRCLVFDLHIGVWRARSARLGIVDSCGESEHTGARSRLTTLTATEAEGEGFGEVVGRGDDEVAAAAAG